MLIVGISLGKVFWLYVKNRYISNTCSKKNFFTWWLNRQAAKQSKFLELKIEKCKVCNVYLNTALNIINGRQCYCCLYSNSTMWQIGKINFLWRLAKNNKKFPANRRTKYFCAAFSSSRFVNDYCVLCIYLKIDVFVIYILSCFSIYSPFPWSRFVAFGT